MHLTKLLDDATILQEIIIVPFANPIGLNQRVLGNHLGRFSTDTGINFNRDWFNFTDAIATKIKDNLTDSADENIKLIRASLLSELDAHKSNKEEVIMKRTLYRLAAVSDIVLDLHCDSEAGLLC